jgi:hypothetical protein
MYSSAFCSVGLGNLIQFKISQSLAGRSIVKLWLGTYLIFGNSIFFLIFILMFVYSEDKHLSE